MKIDPDQAKAREIASNIRELFNLVCLGRQDKENYEAVVQEVDAALRAARREGMLEAARIAETCPEEIMNRHDHQLCEQIAEEIRKKAG